MDTSSCLVIPTICIYTADNNDTVFHVSNYQIVFYNIYT